MIHDFFIVKDGLPLVVKNFSNSNSTFCRKDSLILISGFFTALNSLSNSFEDLGNISELKLSNNNLKLSFLKDKTIQNLIFIITHDDTTDGKIIREILERLSSIFLTMYRREELLQWNGNTEKFNSFERVIEMILENFTNEIYSKSMKSNFEHDKIEDDNLKEVEEEIPEYFKERPVFIKNLSVNPKYYLTGNSSLRVFNAIDGNKTIYQISKELNLPTEQVYNICKNLVKLGFIRL
ncbi:MAG: hypothetical protein ACTSRH_00550 [Promethearchaeota archaeon]